MRLKVYIIFILFFSSLPILKAEKKPDRSRVKPDMHEGIIREAHIIYTYVDEKKRRRLTLDIYRPEKSSSPNPAIVMFFRHLGLECS